MKGAILPPFVPARGNAKIPAHFGNAMSHAYPLSSSAMLDALRSIGVEVHVNVKNEETARTILYSTGYVMHFGEAVCADEESFRVAIAHEMGHLFRSDCLRLMRRPDCRNREHLLACDASINSALDLSPFLNRGITPVTTDSLRVVYGEGVPDATCGWLPVYEYLRSHPPLKGKGNGNGNGNGNGKNGKKAHAVEADVSAIENPSRAEEAHYKVIIKSLARGLISSPSLPVPIPAARNPYFEAALRVSTALRTTSCRGAQRDHYRTWSREGRSPLMRGCSRRYRHRVVVLIDASGSMGEHAKAGLAAARSLAHRYRIATVIYSASVLWRGEGSPSVLPAGWGGGTCITPALQAAIAMGAESVVVYTDGEHEMNFEFPHCPVIWVLTESHRKPPLRVKDRQIIVK